MFKAHAFIEVHACASIGFKFAQSFKITGNAPQNEKGQNETL